MIRILVIEDSVVVARVLTLVFDQERDLAVVGVAKDGAEGVKMALRLKPDVITMDVRMPGLDGLETTRQIMRLRPTPIVMVTASTDVDIGFRALQAGAVDLFEKPSLAAGAMATQQAARLVATVRAMAQVRVVRLSGDFPAAAGRATTPKGAPRVAATPTFRAPRVLAIGASTGGPPALQVILSALPRELPAPVLVAQHIASPFVAGLVSWLGESTGKPIHIAESGMVPLAGHVYFSSDERHLILRRDGKLDLIVDRARPYSPSVDALFESVAEAVGSAAVAVILTGMGNDGARGLLALKGAGAATVAQHETGCCVYGMPRAAVEIGAAADIVPLPRIARHCSNLFLPPKSTMEVS